MLYKKQSLKSVGHSTLIYLIFHICPSIWVNANNYFERLKPSKLGLKIKGEQVNKLRTMDTIDYYTAVKMSEPQLHASI